MTITIPNLLKAGDLVAVVAPARVVNEEAVKKGVKILSDWGLQVWEGKSLYKSHELFAGTDHQRLEDLQAALDNPDIKAIICARGGYGTTRIIDELDWNSFKQSPKWVCGFSDITSLLCHIHNMGFACIHSSMPQLFTEACSEPDISSLRQALFEMPDILKSGPSPNNQAGQAEGTLIGGNLSILVHLIGSSSDVNTDGKILLIEEVNEYQYQLDRMMVQLARSSKLSQLAGIAVGHLTNIKEGDLKFSLDARGIIKSHLGHLKIPIGFDLPFGHESPNLAIPMGVKGILTVDDNGSTIELKY